MMAVLSYEFSKGIVDFRTGTIDSDTKVLIETEAPDPVILLEQAAFLHALETLIEYMRIQGITRVEIV